MKGDDGPPSCVAILSPHVPLKCLFCWASLRPCLAPRLWPPGSPPAPPSRLSPSHTHTPSVISLFSSLPSSTYILSAEPGLLCLHPPYCYFSPHYTLPQQLQPGHAGSPAGGPDGVLASGPALGSLSLQDGSAALLWPIWPRPVLAPVCDYGPAGRRQSWRGKRCQCAAE